jgi:hypothetical protein
MHTDTSATNYEHEIKCETPVGLLVVEAALYTCPLVHFGAALTVLF